jgi:putative ABC transport system permease protein
VDAFLSDLRFAARMLRRQPAFCLAIIAIVAIGIGATSSMFSVVRAVLLEPPPFPSHDRVVVLWAPQPIIKQAPLSGPDFKDWKEGSKSFSSMAAIHNGSFNLVEGGEPQRIAGVRVSSEYFDVLGIQPAVGRSFTRDEDRQDSRVVVISDRFHRERFDGDPQIAGREIVLDGIPHTVIGVLPEGIRFTGPRSSGDLWVPLGLDPVTGDGAFTGRGNHYLHVIARLADGVTPEAAEAELRTIAAQLEETYDSNAGVSASVVVLQEELIGRLRPGLLMLFGAIALVLLIACANVANLLVARSSARRMEIAMRVALGASRGRLVRQLLTESVFISVTGGLVGIVITLWGVDLLAAALGGLVPSSVTIGVDAIGVAFSVGLSVLVGIVFGVMPAASATRLDVYEALKEGAARGSAGPRRARLREALVVAEVAMAFALLVGAGLLGRSFLEVSSIHPGFETAGVETAQLLLSDARYEDQDRRRQLVGAVIERLDASPGITAVGATDFLPMTGQNTNGDFEIEGRPPWAAGESPILERRRATADYFRVMGAELKRGRFFEPSDDAASTPVTIVNESAAKFAFGDEDPIGKRIRWNTDGDAWREIVGVVGDLRTNGLDQDVPLESYVPYAQFPTPHVTFVAKTSGGAVSPKMIADAVLAVDPMQPVFHERPLEQIVADRGASRRFYVTVLALFAVTALLLAAMGLFGIVSYQTSQRTREIGIRVALGAQAREIAWLVLTGALKVVAVGLAFGILLASLLSTTLERFLFGVSAFDPVVYLALGVMLGGVALVASYIPARRAADLVPAVALRDE